MTSIDTWPLWIAIIVAGGAFPLWIVSFAYSLYLSHRHLDAMMEALKNSRFIYLWGPAWRGRGWFGGVVLISKISGMVVWSRAHIRNGDADPGDIENFPPYLKRRLAIDLVMVALAFTWGVAGGLLVQFR
jgi:hypothetical protein